MRSCPTSLAGDPGEAADLTNVLGVAEEWPQLVLEDGESDWTRDGEGVRLEPLVLESPIADGESPVRMPLVDGTRASDDRFEAFPAWQQLGAGMPCQDPCGFDSRWWFEQPEASFQAMTVDAAARMMETRRLEQLALVETQLLSLGEQLDENSRSDAVNSRRDFEKLDPASWSSVRLCTT